MAADVIRVVLADDHTVVLAGLKSLLHSARDIAVVGEARNGTEAVALAKLEQPDVLIMDLDMPGLDGVAATKEIVESGLSTRVLVLTMHAEEEYLVSVIQAGAAGFLVKTDADRELLDAIRAVAHGDVYVKSSAARVLAKNLVKKETVETDRERFERLTARERDVLRYVGLGYSAPEIGRRLSISPKTVDTYKQRIQEKLQLAHRSQYVQFALRLGLLA